MAQHDFNIANQPASDVRQDINNALVALVTNSSGSSDPATTFANMFYYDTSDNRLKLRNEANDAWTRVLRYNQSGGRIQFFEGTELVNTSDVVRAVLDVQPEATWESGTATTETFISPAKLKAAITAQAPAQSTPIGDGQVWETVSRTAAVVYNNGKTRPVQISCTIKENVSGATTSFQVSVDGSTNWVTLGVTTTSTTVQAIIPEGHHYRVVSDVGTATISSFAILR